MQLHYRIVQFISLSAWDLFVPGFITQPVGLVRNFYKCFLVADPYQKLELLQEARRLTTAEVEEIVDAMAAEWESQLPGGKLTEPQRDLLRQLVRCLQSAGEPSAAADPSEALRKSLNDTIMVQGQERIRPIILKPDQLTVGRTMVMAGMMRNRNTRGICELPASTPNIPGHQLISVLGNGGFSKVYLGTNIETGERRAIKVGPLENNTKFEREARLLASLEGPYVVRYHEHGTIDGSFWIAMEYLGEFTLADLIATNPSAEIALLLAGQLLRGLEGLHKAGVIHRDLKPANAMVDPQFQLKLIDFGLAKPLPGSQVPHTRTMTIGLTVTPRYMAPELMLEEKASPAADIWAFGCVLYELLTGSPPFQSNNEMALGHEIMTKELVFNQPRIPEEVRPFLSHCLKRTAFERWTDAVVASTEFVRVAAEARRRLRHERFQESWEQIVEKGLLERFAATHKARIPDDAVSRFTELARQEEIAEVDDERLGEVIGPVFAAQGRCEAANLAVFEAKASLQKEILSLTGEQLAQRSARIRELEEVRQERLGEVQNKVRELLSDELRSLISSQTEAERWHHTELSGSTTTYWEDIILLPIRLSKLLVAIFPLTLLYEFYFIAKYLHDPNSSGWLDRLNNENINNLSNDINALNEWWKK